MSTSQTSRPRLVESSQCLPKSLKKTVNGFPFTLGKREPLSIFVRPREQHLLPQGRNYSTEYSTLSMATYLVTGGSGFIGSNIVEELIKKGETVRVLDNFSTGRRTNLTAFVKDIELIEGDLQNYHVALKAVRNVDFVLHQAALPSVPRSIADPISSHNANVNATLNLLHASNEARVKRLVFASSSSVYGDTEVSPKVESLIPNPKSPYAVSKLTCEHYCRVFYQLYGLETVCLRYFNVFGARQDPGSQYSAVIPKFLRAILNDQRPIVFGDGSQTRDFTYVANNVWANLQACEAPNVGGKVFNIACGENYSLNDLINLLNELTGKSIEPIYENVRAGDILHSTAGIERAKEELLYRPLVTFRDGLKLLIEKFEG
jgi:nucleoside-diphosphate-sugar epimerase